MSDLKAKTSQMSRIAKIGGVAVVLVIALAVGGAFAYDASKKDQIAPGVQIAGIVDEALDASRQGGLPSRLVRYATDSEVNKDLPPRIGYSSAKLQEQVK